MKARDILAKEISEASFQADVIQLAQLNKWRVAHFRPAKTNKGWRTAVSANGAGFPDLILVKEQRVLAVELKSISGKLSHEQKNWLAALANTPVETFVWTPADWPTIHAELEKREPNHDSS